MAGVVGYAAVCETVCREFEGDGSAADGRSVAGTVGDLSRTTGIRTVDHRGVGEMAAAADAVDPVAGGDGAVGSGVGSDPVGDCAGGGGGAVVAGSEFGGADCDGGYAAGVVGSGADG